MYGCALSLTHTQMMQFRQTDIEAHTKHFINTTKHRIGAKTKQHELLPIFTKMIIFLCLSMIPNVWMGSSISYKGNTWIFYNILKKWIKLLLQRF